ncbi:hypothetical protein [Deinococcus sp.]|uniref:hypothetical protein n=1 Tax=Deinococcus sp. TaxID=47478 RepID=UPI003C7D65FC
MQQRDLLTPDILAELPGLPAGARLLQLELTDEPTASPVTRPDLARFEEAVGLMRQGRFDQARTLLVALTERLPASRLGDVQPRYRRTPERERRGEGGGPAPYRTADPDAPG